MGFKHYLSICFVGLLIAYGISISKVQKLRADRPSETRRAQALAVDPTLLRVISGPFKGLAADYLNMKASIFMGGAWEVTEEDWEAVYTLMKQSLYLDPLFFQTGYYIQGLLAWRPPMHRRAVELLRIHAEARYWDWEPMFYVGFDYSYYLKDNDSAAKYMKLSAERPGAPSLVPSLAARMSQKAGQTITAIALLKTMYESAQDEKTKAYYEKRLQAHLAVRQLEMAVESFQERYGRRPARLRELVGGGIIRELPRNPFSVPFIYDPGSGVIFFDENQARFDFPYDPYESVIPFDDEP